MKVIFHFNTEKISKVLFFTVWKWHAIVTSRHGLHAVSKIERNVFINKWNNKLKIECFDVDMEFISRVRQDFLIFSRVTVGVAWHSPLFSYRLWMSSTSLKCATFHQQWRRQHSHASTKERQLCSVNALWKKINI